MRTSESEKYAYEENDDCIPPGFWPTVCLLGLFAVLYIYIFEPLFWWATRLYVLNDNNDILVYTGIEHPSRERWHAV